eukprot:CAMPEP_0201604408 /NCGR_PEP_ID=MMETSP0492-20130828/4563_1 /ASSEMBLY_ACC=CAM_ASM_000837 /TAXON_ID=420259 /ORGANISM="Thalassiosira gravida, Strain GMp14c1" /LENGTH=109 /DNA_ID=CAMNT_0048068433 /DNA_START=313 /DNA_END=643 /DNA_ORIENTATION=-
MSSKDIDFGNSGDLDNNEEGLIQEKRKPQQKRSQQQPPKNTKIPPVMKRVEEANPKKEKINDAAVESGSKEEGDSDNDKFGDDNLNEYNQDAFMVDEDKDEDDDGVRVS